MSESALKRTKAELAAIKKEMLEGNVSWESRYNEAADVAERLHAEIAVLSRRVRTCTYSATHARILLLPH